MSTPYGNIRIGDNERMQAMDTLGRALGEGRLTMDEFDHRCSQVAKAKTNGELRAVLADLPAGPAGAPGVPGALGAHGATGVPGAAGGSTALGLGASTALSTIDYGGQGPDKLYTAKEIMDARRNGQRMRAGMFGLGSVASLGLIAVHPMFMLLIPTLFILLYVMKVGPASWYTPSLRELEKNRRAEIRVQQLQLEQANAYEAAQRKLERKAQIDQLTGDALNVAQETVNRFKPKN